MSNPDPHYDPENTRDEDYVMEIRSEEGDRHEPRQFSANLSNDNLPPYASLDRFNEQNGL